MNITLEQLESLLFEQKQLVIKKLLSQTYAFNAESTQSDLKTINNLDKNKFEEIGMSAGLPKDIEVLKKYL